MIISYDKDHNIQTIITSTVFRITIIVKEMLSQFQWKNATKYLFLFINFHAVVLNYSLYI